MTHPTTGPCPWAASVLFNLPEYHVAEVERDDDGDRRVVIMTPAREAACPDCGVVSTRVHQRTRQRLKDVAFDGHVSVEWVKKRWRCAEPLCVRATFTEHTEQVPPRARLTQRLRQAITDEYPRRWGPLAACSGAGGETARVIVSGTGGGVVGGHLINRLLPPCV